MHIDMDAFFVSVEEVLDPSLRGKPVVVGGDPAGREVGGTDSQTGRSVSPGKFVSGTDSDPYAFPARGVVAAASYKAREYGIHSAMPLAQAKRLCPHAIFLRGKYDQYVECSEKIMGIFRRYSPVVEPVSLDEAYLDLTGCERMHHASVLGIGERIRNEIQSEVGVNASIGIAGSRMVAKVASDEAKPNGMLWVAPGREREFLAPLPIRKMPGIGEKSGEIFQELGIRRIGDLTRFPPELLAKVFGKHGRRLHRRARGEDGEPVVEWDKQKSLGREITFDQDTIDPAYLECVLGRLVERLGKTLRDKHLAARCVTLKLRYSDFKTYTRRHTLPGPTDLDTAIFSAAVELFRDLFVRRTRIRLIGVSLSSLRLPEQQLDLFEEHRLQKLRRLYDGLDRIKARHGSRAVVTGRTFLALRSEDRGVLEPASSDGGETG